MNLAREIKKDIYWIGVNDRRTHIFENYWPLPKVLLIILTSSWTKKW